MSANKTVQWFFDMETKGHQGDKPEGEGLGLLNNPDENFIRALLIESTRLPASVGEQAFLDVCVWGPDL